MLPVGLNFGLGALPLLSQAKTRSISAENPNGEKAGGALAVPDAGNAGSDLGTGWKIRPCITLAGGSTTTLADVEGPGVIQHIWITVDPRAYRDCVLRMYWEGEDAPSVETPLGDFFACGHGLRYKVDSLPVAVNPSGGFTERGSRSDGTVPTHSCSPVQPGTGIRRPAFDALIGSSPRTR